MLRRVFAPRSRHLLLTVLTIAALFAAGPAAAQMIVVPDLKPPPTSPAKPSATSKPTTHPMVGHWFTVTKGSMICSFGSGVIDIAATSTGGIDGHADLGGFTGDFTRMTVKDRMVSFGYNYTDSFGNAALVTFAGTLSDDGNFVSGVTGGTWEDGCTFTMQRN